jgi:hypothetical protein
MSTSFSHLLRFACSQVYSPLKIDLSSILPLS